MDGLYVLGVWSIFLLWALLFAWRAFSGGKRWKAVESGFHVNVQ
jgi:hypothetical protein